MSDFHQSVHAATYDELAEDAPIEVSVTPEDDECVVMEVHASGGYLAVMFDLDTAVEMRDIFTAAIDHLSASL